MSVMIVTSLGEMIVDLYVDKCPLTTKNFLKLCKMKYYNGCLFHTVQKDFTAQTGDPTGTGTGGDSVYKYLYGEQARFFGDEIRVDLKHSKTGTVAMASAGENLNASQFYITLRDDLDYLDGKHTVFGEVAEGFETLTRINEAYVDEKNRPYKNIRIKHTYIVDDPFDDPPQLADFIPDASPEGKPKDEVDDEVRLEDDWVPLDEQLAPQDLEEVLRAKDAYSSAVVLETIGDIPLAEIKPPENVLFVCKLNPVTEDEDLHTIFSRFGTVVSAEVIRDFKTGDSLCYAFIEFENQESCEQAYYKMDNTLIDDRRIHVDFSQSVSKLWKDYITRDKTGKGNGCFKCGAPDHFAKDCTGQEPTKYILKDADGQHGDNNSKYEMVFDEDTSENPKREKRQRDHDREDQVEKPNMNMQDADLKDRDREKKDLGDRHRESDRSRDHRDSRMNPDSKASRYGGSRRDHDYLEERRAKEMHVERRGERDDDSRDERDYRKRSSDIDRRRDRRDDGDYRKRSIDEDNRRDRRDDGDYRKRNVDNDSRGGGDRRGDGDYKKRNADGDINGDRRDDRDRKNYGHGDRRDTRKEPGYRRDTEDDDGRKKRREEQESRRRVTETDDDRDRDRRHRGDKRR
ncbi:hypothetical protein Q3G72_020503 [Acer saccharum]|nr:hypothetical protein Q3G72_020503 [Acer saccharum]